MVHGSDNERATEEERADRVFGNAARADRRQGGRQRQGPHDQGVCFFTYFFFTPRAA